MKEFFKNILLVSLPVFIIFFLALEIFIRVSKEHIDLYGLTGRAPMTNPMSKWANVDAFAAYSAKPGEYNKGRDGKSVNSGGFISTPEISLEKPENTVRIVFLGGSSTAGTGKNLNDEDTWPWLVAENLREKLKGTDIKVDFINAGLSGYSTFESYGKLWSRLRFYKPDIVVVNHAWNEMYYFNDKIAADPTSWKKREDGSWSVDNQATIMQIKPHWVDPFMDWSQVLSRVRLRFAEGANGEAGDEEAMANGTLSNTYNKKGLEIFRENLKLIEATAQSIGADVFVMKQATLLTPNTSAEDKARSRYDYHGFDHNAHVDAYNRIYGIIENEVDQEHIIDATPVSGVSKNFHDHVHPTEEGAENIAEIVTDRLYEVYFKNLSEKNLQLTNNRYGLSK